MKYTKFKKKLGRKLIMKRNKTMQVMRLRYHGNRLPVAKNTKVK